MEKPEIPPQVHSRNHRGPLPFVVGFALIIVGLALGWASRPICMSCPSKESDSKSDIQTLSASLIRYKTRGGFYPTTEQGLMVLVTEPTSSPQPKRWQRLHREEDLIDRWGNQFRYRFPGIKNPDGYDVYTIGPDGMDGTEDDIGNF